MRLDCATAYNMETLKVIGIVIFWVFCAWVMGRIKESVYPTKSKKSKDQYFKDEEKKRDNYFK